MLACVIIFMLLLLSNTETYERCGSVNVDRWEFHLVRVCQRSVPMAESYVALENVHTLRECVQLAKHMRGLAFNFANRKQQLNSRKDFNHTSYISFKNARNQLNVYQQPQEFFDCHVLQCPENVTFGSMVNDSRFDYYTLYGRPTTETNYTCVPELGLFYLHTTSAAYVNASNICSNSSAYHGSLAHIGSEHRTRALANLLANKADDPQSHTIFMAYVGLHYNRTFGGEKEFFNAENESLNCFLFRAWDVNHPKFTGTLLNASCVVLTPEATWKTVSCSLDLPFICEISIAVGTQSQLDIGLNAASECDAISGN